MRKGMLILILPLVFAGLGGWLSGGADEAIHLNEETGTESKAIARLEQRILQLEKRLSALEQGDDIQKTDGGWKSRASGSKVVNGSRVYVLPLSHASQRD